MNENETNELARAIFDGAVDGATGALQDSRIDALMTTLRRASFNATGAVAVLLTRVYNACDALCE